ALAAAAACALPAGTAANLWRLDYAAMKGAAPDKTIVGTLQSDPAARVLRTDWDSFARTDAVATSDDRRRILFVDGGAGSYMYKYDGDLASMDGLARDIEFLPFAAGKADKAIIVGAGGGRDILYAQLAGAKDVTAVELSSGLVRAARSMADYNGGILDLPGVHTVVGDGRSVLERSGESYDLIVLDLVYSQVGGVGGQALSENYAFTREAFATYLKRLTPDGRIIVISHQGIEGLRAYYTGFEALMRADGLPAKEAASHTALLLAPEGSAAPNLTLSVIQKSQLADGQLELLRAGARSLGLQKLFLPGSDEALLKPLLDGRTPFGAFVRDSDYKVYPTTDDKPFFFLVEPSLPKAMTQWLAAIAALTLLFALLAWRRGAPRGESRGRPGAYAYYGLIGVGYMCIQTVWIQKSLAYAGTPALAALVVIVPMLLGGALGSRIAGRQAVKPLAAAAAIVALTAVLLVLQAAAGESLMALGQAGRLSALGGIMLLYGVLLGIPLPAGLQAEDRRAPGSSAYYFALNGVAGVWGSWLAVAASVTAGLAVTLAAGCACYALLAVTRYRLT
ncbi:class I SAM-dependent methyltransferase, partial [Paenibacillus sp. MWE-103]